MYINNMSSSMLTLLLLFFHYFIVLSVVYRTFLTSQKSVINFIPQATTS